MGSWAVPSAPSGTLTVVITVCTRARPALLAQCLEAVLRVSVPVNVRPCLAVVENGTTPDARDFVEQLARQADGPWIIRYAHEPRTGIPFARNRSLQLALELSPDWIAFIDDDETVDPRWLERMVAAAQELRLDVLQGPVEYLYPDGIPDWLQAKEVKPRPRGSRLRTAYTNNTLMASRLARDDGLALRFDETMQFTGGSDSDFFFRAADLGASIGWVDDAWVREVVGPSRLSVTWQWMRALRVAANASVIHRKRKGSVWAILRYGPKSLTRIVRGGSLLLVGAAVVPFARRRGRRLLFAGGKDVASGAGGAMGLLGWSPQPYRTVA